MISTTKPSPIFLIFAWKCVHYQEHDIKKLMSYHIMEFYMTTCHTSRLSWYPYYTGISSFTTIIMPRNTFYLFIYLHIVNYINVQIPDSTYLMTLKLTKVWTNAFLCSKFKWCVIHCTALQCFNISF